MAWIVVISTIRILVEHAIKQKYKQLQLMHFKLAYIQ